MVSFHWQPEPDIEQTAALWAQLSSQIETTLFLSEAWIITWLKSYQRLDWLLSIKLDGEIIALGLFCKQAHRRSFGFHSNVLHLQAVGVPAYDQIWPEYNGLLCSEEHKALIYPRLVQQVFDFHQSVDELDMGLITEQSLQRLVNDNGAVSYTHLTLPTIYSV